MNSTDPRPNDDWNLEDAADAADTGDVEELDIATAKRGMGPVATALVTVTVALLVVAGAGFGWWMWQNHWRQVSITVDGDQLHARADTTVAQFLKDHDSFQRKPGRLVSLKGDVLEPAGGNAVQVKLDGTAIPVSEYGSTTLARATTMTVTPGTDRTEEHTVEQRTVPFTTDINLNNGPIQVVTQQGEDGTDEIWIGKRSKQEIKKRTVEPMKKLTVQSFSPQPEGKKVIALTFDDGPSQYTGPILDILKKKKVKATFFDLGEEALAMPALEQRMVKEGHQVASHSVSHPYLPNMSAQELRKEITTSFADLKEASGTVTRTLRAPYGAFGVQQWKDAATVLDRNVLWTIDTLDWKRPGAKAIHDEVMKNAYNGAVALMHDGGGDRTQDI